MVHSTKSPRRSYSKGRSYLFTKIAGAVLLFASGCNTAFSPSTGDGPDPSTTLDSSVSPGDSTTGGSVAPAGDSGPSQPSLSISAKPIFCCNPLSIDFDAVHADPIDGRRVSRYAWDFGDGYTTLGKTVNHTYARPATYTVEVVATYVDGTSELTDTTLTVGLSEPPPPPDHSTTSGGDSSTAGNDSPAETPPADLSTTTPPAETADTVYADAGPDQTINEGDVVLLDAGNSRGSGTTALNYAWRQLSGPAVQLLTPNAARATFVAPTGRANTSVLSFELTVQQAASSGTDVVGVTVVPPATVTPPVDPTLPSKEQLTAWLADLPPLPKVHYSCPDIMLPLDDPRYVEYVRITHAAGVSGEWCTASQIEAIVRMCKEVNAATATHPAPAIPASIAINYSPWHDAFGADLPPTDTGPTHVAELATFRERLSTIRQWLAEANLANQSDIRVTAILLDTERFNVKPASDPTSATWNAAIDAKYTAIFDIASELYPDARIEWFDRGINESDSATGWSPVPWFTFREPGDAFSCALYSVPEIGTMRETFRRTYDFAGEHGVTAVTPWVALGAGYRRQPDQLHAWYTDWDYDTVYSMLLGREINLPSYGQQPDRYAPLGAAEVVVFYPPPFDSRTPAWGKHFVAYARGAAGIDELP